MRAVAVLVVSFAIAAGQQVSTADADREKDVYTIYSLIMTNPETSHGPGGNEKYLIRDTTQLGQPNEPCVAPPPNRSAEFQEVMDDFRKRKGAQRRLERKLTVDKPYELLNPDEVKQFLEERRSGRFQGVSDVFTLSDVYFNRRRTLALTALSSWCGDLCAQWRWRVFEKGNDGKWREQREWVSCFSIS